MYKKTSCWIFLILIISIFPVKGQEKKEILLLSPDKKLQFRIYNRESGLHFSLSQDNKPVIEDSPIHFTLDNLELTKKVKVGKEETYLMNETYPLKGGQSTATNNCNGIKIALASGKQEYLFEARAFNNGAAFRIIVPGDPSQSHVPDESTVFKIPGESSIWYHDLNMHYEGLYSKKMISLLKDTEWVAPPVTIKLPEGGYASITEADLKEYSGMAFKSDGKNGLVVHLAHTQPVSYPYKLRYPVEDVTRLSKAAAISGNITTPWRVVKTGLDLNSMVNNNILYSLCPPPDKNLFPDGSNTDWIKPGRAVWKYLDGGGEGTLEVMKDFSNKASKLGFEHNILEGFWSKWPEKDLVELVEYSKKQGVGIWLWKHSKDLRDPNDRQQFFKKCHDLGITGVKLDFFDHEAKEVIDLYQAILRETAEQKLLVDFHGANKPTGQWRTWPNELVLESVKGMEASKLADRATHETTIPFTRFLAGPAEYTVTHFGDRKKNTTSTHQIASAAILSAPLLTYAANPDQLLASPAVEIIKNIPSTWDETIVLPPSEIGELAVFARRKGNTWFLAAMNGLKERTIDIPLSFLKDGNYQTILAHDNSNDPSAVRMENSIRNKKDVLKIKLRSGGGYIEMLKP